MRRTYSERPQKRQRIDSPDPENSPPSSPEFSRPVKKPSFSLLKRPSSTPLATTSQNALDRRKATPKPKPKKMKQTALDIGQPTTITCPACNMSYTPSQPTDAALHARHHHATSAALSAPELPLLVRRALDAATDATSSSSSSAANVVWADGGGEESVVRVTRRDEVGLRRAAERVLRAATLDLGAVDVSAVDLWAERKEVGVEAEGKGGRRERYQVFIFLRRRKCVGLLLAEWISSGFSVVNSGFPIITSNCEGISEADKREHPAMLGISRIWTHRSERRNGVATKLLDAARTGFQPLFVVNKDKVAFSQPTELGASLARKWFGRDEGWLVYRD